MVKKLPKVVIDTSECNPLSTIGAKVFIDGKQFLGITDISTDLEVDSLQTVTMTFCASDVEIIPRNGKEKDNISRMEKTIYVARLTK